jgi:hypothetical protein
MTTRIRGRQLGSVGLAALSSLALAGVGAAPALADGSVGSVKVDSVSPGHAGVHVNVTLQPTGNGQYRLDVTNDSSNSPGNVITGVSFRTAPDSRDRLVEPDNVTIDTPNNGSAQCFFGGPYRPFADGASCDDPYGADPGQTEHVSFQFCDYQENSAGEPEGCVVAPNGDVSSVNVTVSSGGFRPTMCDDPFPDDGSGVGAYLGDRAAVMADACTPPSHTKITQAKINGNTAFFRFTAQHATAFQCVLVRNGRVMFSRACRSPKPYANPLPHGNYMFIVRGTNKGGFAQKPAIKRFQIK